MLAATAVICLARPAAAVDAAPLDLNTASVAEIEKLPGIGASKAQAIVARRDATPFRSVDELRDVKGIGDRLLEQLRPLVRVGGVGSVGAAGGADPVGRAPAGAVSAPSASTAGAGAARRGGS